MPRTLAELDIAIRRLELQGTRLTTVITAQHPDLAAHLALGLANATIVPPSTDVVSVTKSADQTIPNISWTAVTWDQEDFATAGMHDNATNNARITIVTPGIKLITLTLGWIASTAGYRLLAVLRNSERLVEHTVNPNVSGGGSRAAITMSAILRLSAADYLEVQVYQTSGGNLDIDAAFAGEFTTRWVVHGLSSG